MRIRIHSRNISLSLAAAALVFSTTARAEHLNPTGAHSEAQLAAAAVTTTSAGGGQAKATTNAPDRRAQAVKRWVKNQWNSLASYFGNDEPQPVAVKAPTAPQAPVANKPAAPALAANPAPAAPPVAPSIPNAPLEKSLRAPAQAAIEEHAGADAPGVTRTANGVASYDLSNVPAIPRLSIEKEEPIPAGTFALDARMQKLMGERMVQAADSPAVMSEKELKAQLALRVPRAGEVQNVKLVSFGPHGKISREAFDKIVLQLKPEAQLQLKKFTPLSPEETRFLSGLLLYQQGDNCPTAIGLFYKLSKSKGWESESNYYIAMCSKKMGLQTDFFEGARRVLATQDVFYSKKILGELSTDVPYEISDEFGSTLLRTAGNSKIMDKLPATTLANVAYILADYSVSSEHFKTALAWAKQVPPEHPKYLKAQFLLALAEYHAGSKDTAIKIEDAIVNDKQTDQAKMEFQALVALNAGRMHFQERNFKLAHENFQKVYKDHPLWLTSLTEMGWAQLEDGDYEGAIGNMYSIQSPFFTAVYKPESYVIRTIGYLNLCQYGDAYRTLSVLERDYRPYLDKMTKYMTRKTPYYPTVKSFFKAAKGTTEVDGLPMPVVREMARHRDFTNLQKALNRQIDERPNYNIIDGEVERRLRNAQNAVTATRKYADMLRKKIALPGVRHDKNARQDLDSELDQTLAKLNDQFFMVDLFTEAKVGIDEYRKDVIGGADQRIAHMHKKIETVLANRLLRMKVDLARVLENNELLRYEVFAGSGENIRFQVAGGEAAKRIPASVIPKSKALQWDFDGEYWEDEIGHYRSSLKNNCPDKRSQASNDGGIK